MEIFAEFSHVVMFAKILFRNYCCRLVAILWLSRQFSQCVLFLALFLFFSVWLSTSAKRIVSKQKVFLVRTVFVCVCVRVWMCLCSVFSPYVCWLFHRISFHLELYMRVSFTVSTLSMCVFSICHTAFHITTGCHCHWIPVVLRIVHRAPKKYFDLMEAICIFQDLRV